MNNLNIKYVVLRKENVVYLAIDVSGVVLEKGIYSYKNFKIIVFA